MPAKPFMMCITPLRSQKAQLTLTLRLGRGRATTWEGDDVAGQQRGKVLTWQGNNAGGTPQGDSAGGTPQGDNAGGC